MVFIRNKVYPKQEEFYHKILQYLLSVLLVNGLILLLLLAFFSNGNKLIFNLNHQKDFAIKYAILAMVMAVAEPFFEKYLKIKHISTPIKVIAFFLICALLLRVANYIAQPVWENAEYNPTYGIYSEPENTVESLFIGTSHIRSGISPMELYKNYGICAYDISTSGQPTAASYFWIEEAYRLNEDTLDTVIFDVSSLRKGFGSSNYHIAIDPMHFSPIKLQAVGAYSKNFKDFFSNLVPLFSYHDRWKELANEDFSKDKIEPQKYLRGYYFTVSQWIDHEANYFDIHQPLLLAEKNTEVFLLNEEALKYFDRMVSFCEEHNIRLVLIKTPANWSSEEHNAVQTLADDYGLDFIDFNIEPYYSDIGFDLSANLENPADINNLHANYYGSVKITDYLGNYLIQECGNRDVRGDEKYGFMDEELEEYSRYIIKTELEEIEDPSIYLADLLERDDYEIFISVKGDGSLHLTDEQREYFASVGLDQLSALGYKDSYLAVIDDGTIIVEDSREYDENLDLYGDAKDVTEAMTITAEGVLEDGTDYSLTSCGGNTAAKSSCVLDGMEYSVNTEGFNFVVYDKKLQFVVDETVFDTHSSSTRKSLNVESALSNDLDAGVEYTNLSGDEKKLYRYDMLVNAEMAEKTSGADGFLNYLSYFWDSDDYTIFIAANGDASEALSDEVRDFLADIGLRELPDLQYRDSYIAIASGGEIWEEMKSSGTDPIEADGPGYTVISGINDAENDSSIIINGTERSLNTRGLNVVVVSNKDSSFVSAMSFDTYETTPSIPDNWPAE